MLIEPLLLSFVSLAVYYLIGIVAQVLKIGLAKRLNAWAITKFDTGEFEKKTVVESLKKEINRLKTGLRAQETIEKELIQEIKDLETEHDTEIDGLEAEIKELEGTIAKNNLQFTSKQKEVDNLIVYQKQFNNEKSLYNSIEKGMLKLFADFHSRPNAINGLFGTNISLEPREVMEGEWRAKVFTQFNKGSFSEKEFTINGLNIYQGEVFYGTISQFKYDKDFKFITFLSTKEANPMRINLIRVAKNQLIGFWGNETVELVKPDTSPKF